METKHTPGPWLVKHSESKDAFNVVGTQLGCNYKIARCAYLTINDCPLVSKQNKKEANANAKLIAAAPDLLKFVMSMAERYGKSEWIHDEAIKLINKAI